MPKKVHKIHDALMDDPKFKPRKRGETKDEAAWAVAQATAQKSKPKKKKSK